MMTETEKQAMRAAIDIMKHSLFKPDSSLRLEAKENKCYGELLVVVAKTHEFLENLRETYKP